MASPSSLPNKGLDPSALKSKRETLIDIKGCCIRLNEGQSQPGTSRNNSMWYTWQTVTNQPLRFQALHAAKSILANNSWKCAKKTQRKMCKETAMCLCVFCEQKNMLYLWNKLGPEKCSLSSELWAVKSANWAKVSFLLPKEAGKYGDMDEMSLILFLKCELPIVSHFNSSHPLDDRFCCYPNALVYSLTNAD